MTIFRSEPVKVIWSGWESDTLKLQRCGWEVSAHESPYNHHIGIAIRHREMGVSGLSDMINYDYMQRLARSSADYYNAVRASHFVFSMQMGQQVMVHMMGPTPEYYPVDTTPIRMEEKTYSLDDMAWFQPIPKPVEVVPPSFDEIMQMALEHQAPKQKELRAKARKQMREPLIIRAVA